MKKFILYAIKGPGGMTYAGGTIDFERRRLQHLSELRLGNHANKHLQDDYIIHGEQAFEFLIVEYCKSQYDLDTKEKRLISKVSKQKLSYNVILNTINKLSDNSSKLRRIMKSATGSANKRIRLQI